MYPKWGIIDYAGHRLLIDQTGNQSCVVQTSCWNALLGFKGLTLVLTRAWGSVYCMISGFQRWRIEFFFFFLKSTQPWNYISKSVARQIPVKWKRLWMGALMWRITSQRVCQPFCLSEPSSYFLLTEKLAPKALQETRDLRAGRLFAPQNVCVGLEEVAVGLHTDGIDHRDRIKEPD